MHYLSHYLNIRVHNAYKVMNKVMHQFCGEIGRLVKNEQNVGMAIADEIHNFKEYGKQECNGHQVTE